MVVRSSSKNGHQSAHMSDYCLQCSTRIFGEDFKELAGITTLEEWAQERACIVLCEGCGPIQVDPEGRCVSSDCFCGHGGEKVKVQRLFHADPEEK